MGERRSHQRAIVVAASGIAIEATTAAGKASALATHYRQAASYLYVSAAGGGLNGSCRMVYWDGVSLSLGQFDMEEPLLRRSGMPIGAAIRLVAEPRDGKGRSIDG